MATINNTLKEENFRELRAVLKNLFGHFPQEEIQEVNGVYMHRFIVKVDDEQLDDVKVHINFTFEEASHHPVFAIDCLFVVQNVYATEVNDMYFFGKYPEKIKSIFGTTKIAVDNWREANGTHTFIYNQIFNKMLKYNNAVYQTDFEQLESDYLKVLQKPFFTDKSKEAAEMLREQEKTTNALIGKFVEKNWERLVDQALTDGNAESFNELLSYKKKGGLAVQVNNVQSTEEMK